MKIIPKWLRGQWILTSYKVRHWMFQWNYCEQDNSIVFTFLKVIHFLKYKEHTLVYFGQGWKTDTNFTVKPAKKYVYANPEEAENV